MYKKEIKKIMKKKVINYTVMNISIISFSLNKKLTPDLQHMSICSHFASKQGFNRHTNPLLSLLSCKYSTPPTILTSLVAAF